MTRSVVLLFSGGIGTRLGGNIPKQYMEVNGRMVIDYCMERLLSCNYVAGLWIVAAEDWRFQITDACRDKQYEMCRYYNYLGSRCDGGFADYVSVPENNLIELPEGGKLRGGGHA